MKSTDPAGISLPTAAYIIDELKFRDPAGKGAVIVFSSDVVTKPAQGGLSTNLIQLLNDLKSVPPPAGETDMVGALKAAYKLISGNKDEKTCVILTDGVPTSLHPELFTGKEREAVERYIRTGKRDEKVLGRMLQELIIKEFLPIYRKSDVKILPIGFGDSDDQFLKQLGGTGGAARVSKVTELIPMVDELIPKGSKILSTRIPMEGGQVTLDVPSGADEVRVVVFYPDAGQTSDNVSPTIQAGGTSIASSDHLEMKTLLGHKAFDRFVVQRPPGGNWTVQLTRKTPTLAYPKAELLVETKINASLRITPDPAQVCVGQKMRIGVAMEGGSAVGLTGLQARVMDEKGSILSTFTIDQPDASGVFSRELPIGPERRPRAEIDKRLSNGRKVLQDQIVCKIHCCVGKRLQVPP